MCVRVCVCVWCVCGCMNDVMLLIECDDDDDGDDYGDDYYC